MFEDDDDDDYEMSELDEWYDHNFMYFKRKSNPAGDMLTGVTFEATLFYNGVYSPVKKEIAPAVRKLMLKQYPIIASESRQLVLEYINDTVNYLGHRMLMNLWSVVEDLKEGINLREKYPKLESWVDFYARPPKAPEPDYTFFDKYPGIGIDLSEEAKKEYVEKMYAEEMFYFLEIEKLKKEYYDIVQPVVLKYFKALEDLDYDGWIIYAVEIREDYEIYKYRCEHLEGFIEYEFDEEDINLGYKEYMAKYSLKYKERLEKQQSSKNSEV